MGSLLTSFNSGVSAIHTAQSGMNTTSHNLANVKTSGYTRQQNIQVDAYYQDLKVAADGSVLQTGMGTGVQMIRQIRDEFLDKEYRLEVGRLSFYEKLAETENEVEEIFGETEGVEFRYSMQALWDSLQEMADNPEDITKRQMFISTADSFLETAQNVYKQLNTYQTSLNTEIVDQVDRVNEIGEQIAALNVQIAVTEASGVENANDYRDARNRLMDELATFTNYTYREDVNGSVQIYLENALFVDNGLSCHLGCELIEDSGLYGVRWLDNGYGKAYEITEAYSKDKQTDIGSLRGILTARGSKMADYADMPQKPQLSDFEDDYGDYEDAETAYKAAMKEYESMVRLYDDTTGNSIIMQIQAQFDQLVHNIVTTINDAFAPNIEVDAENVDLGEAGTALTEKGEEFDLSVLDEGSFRVLDVMNCPIGTDDNETMGTEIFSRSQIDRYQKLTLDGQIYKVDEEGNQVGLAQETVDAEGNVRYTLYLYNDEDITDLDWMYTLNSLMINRDLVADHSLLEVKANPALGLHGAYAFGGELFQSLLNAWDEKKAVLDPGSPATFDFDDYYTNMIGEMGNKGYIWNGMVDYQQSQADGVEYRRQQIMGVSSDEELVSLLKYQHAYNAASRYITTIDSMLQTLIERLG